MRKGAQEERETAPASARRWVLRRERCRPGGVQPGEPRAPPRPPWPRAQLQAPSWVRRFYPLIIPLATPGTEAQNQDEPQTQDLRAASPDQPLRCACTAPAPAPSLCQVTRVPQALWTLSWAAGTISPWPPQPLPNHDESILQVPVGSRIPSVLPSPQLRDTADSFRISPTQMAAPRPLISDHQFCL